MEALFCNSFSPIPERKQHSSMVQTATAGVALHAATAGEPGVYGSLTLVRFHLKFLLTRQRKSQFAGEKK